MEVIIRKVAVRKRARKWNELQLYKGEKKKGESGIIKEWRTKSKMNEAMNGARRWVQSSRKVLL